MNYISRIRLTALLALSSPVAAEARAADWPGQGAETAADPPLLCFGVTRLDALLPAILDRAFKGEL